MITLKYPIKEVDIQTIPENKLLEIGISKNKMALYRQNLKQYGFVTPIVTAQKANGEMMILKGESELSVLKDMNVRKADVFVTNINCPQDIGKAILLLSSLHQELNLISEGMILREILKFGKINQKQLAMQLMKSEGWVSKRLSIAERLADNVLKMVLSKKLCPTAAQDISRLPKEKQQEFAMNVINGNIPKSVVERLVCAYGNKNTSTALKEEIIKSPDTALRLINKLEIKKNSKFEQVKPDYGDMYKFQAAFRLMLGAAEELEAHFAVLDSVTLHKHQTLIGTSIDSLERFLNLIKYVSISPGKPSERIPSECRPSFIQVDNPVLNGGKENAQN